MKIYKVRNNVKDYQALCQKESCRLLMLDGSRRADSWLPPPIYILEPNLIRGNFIGFFSGCLVCDQIATDELDELLKASGELLPLPHKEEQLHVINVTNVFDVLDQEATQWQCSSKTGERLWVHQAAFKGDLLNCTPLFKIPETHRSSIYTIEGLREPEQEFKYNIENRGLTGLKFIEQWSSD
jgi:hypothetical protein